MREKLILIAEGEYMPTQWYQDTLSGVLSQTKRYDLDFRVLSRIPDAPGETLKDARVLLFGMSAAWMARALEALRGLSGVVAINQSPKGMPRSVHTVSIDRTHGVASLMRFLAHNGRRRIALFGVDLHSVGDRERISAYLDTGAELGVEAREKHIYHNAELLSDGADAQCGAITRYGAAECANDYSAAVLLSALGRRGVRVPEDVAVTGYGNLTLCQYTDPPLTSVTMDFREAGIQAVHIVRLLERNGGRVNVNLTLEAQVVPRASAPGAVAPRGEDSVARESGRRQTAFHKDASVQALQAINEMLAVTDDIDRHILAGICDGLPYQAIADAYYISFPALKNRVKRITALCQTESRQELVALMSAYGLRFTR